MTRQRNTRRFNYDGSIAYQGSLYPSTQMDIEDDKGNVSSRNVFADASGQYYTLNEEGNAIPIILQNNLDEVTVTPTPRQATAEERIANQQKQAMMRAAGYNVPMDGSWGAYQEAIWHNLTTKPKEYDNTLTGFAEGLIDRYNGNTTERTNPLYQGEVRDYNPDNIDWSKTRRSQSNFIKQLEGTYGPIVAAATAPALLGSLISAPIATMATLGGGYVGGYAANKASEALTGRDFGTNVAMHTPLTPAMGEMLNPGYAVGAGLGAEYGNFVGNNLANRGRYTLNYLRPSSYANHWLDLPLTTSAPFWRKPPTFYNGRKPFWYDKIASTYGTEAAENRFQNGAIWAGISEDEVPITMYRKNYDGTYRMTNEGVDPRYNDMRLLPEETTVDIDLFTKGGVGGEHSDYTKLAEQDGIKLMEFKDEQKLNPQWHVADKIKKIFNISDGSKMQKAVDYLGGKPLDWLVGYKPFTIKQNYLHDGNNVLPLFMDPIDPYLPVSVRSINASLH